jgi:4-amino-4-deoxy-L-arabinose transferase-like glycosyltransferase
LPQSRFALSSSAPHRTSLFNLLAAVAFVLLLLGFFVHLGLSPLRLEEPRRALISLEMLFRDNWVVPTEMGEYYYKKPPVYNWVIGASYWLWGSQSEWAVRFLSVVSFVATGGLVFLVGLCLPLAGWELGSSYSYTDFSIWLLSKKQPLPLPCCSFW